MNGFKSKGKTLSVFRSNWFQRTPRDMICLQNAQQVMFMKYQLKDVNNYANLLKVNVRKNQILYGLQSLVILEFSCFSNDYFEVLLDKSNNEDMAIIY